MELEEIERELQGSLRRMGVAEYRGKGIAEQDVVLPLIGLAIVELVRELKEVNDHLTSIKERAQEARHIYRGRYGQRRRSERRRTWTSMSLNNS